MEIEALEISLASFLKKPAIKKINSFTISETIVLHDEIIEQFDGEEEIELNVLEADKKYTSQEFMEILKTNIEFVTKHSVFYIDIELDDDTLEQEAFIQFMRKKL